MSFLSFFPLIPATTTASAAPVYHGGMIPCLGDVEPVNTQWLVKGYFPMGAVSVVAGPGGVGKGVFMADVVAAGTFWYLRARMTPACLWLRACSLQGRICAGCFTRLPAGTGSRRRKSLLLGQACLSLLTSCVRHWLLSTRSEAFWRGMERQMVM